MIASVVYQINPNRIIKKWKKKTFGLTKISMNRNELWIIWGELSSKSLQPKVIKTLILFK